MAAVDREKGPIDDHEDLPPWGDPTLRPLGLSFRGRQVSVTLEPMLSVHDEIFDALLAKGEADSEPSEKRAATPALRQ